MTNREWLMNSLSDEELAGVLEKNFNSCDYCIHGTDDNCDCRDCEENIAEWLKEKHIEPMPELEVGDIVEIAPADGIPAKRYVILPNNVAILINNFSQSQPANRITLERLRALSCRMVWRYFPNEYLVIWRVDDGQ